jgi:hypothetical protein
MFFHASYSGPRLGGHFVKAALTNSARRHPHDFASPLRRYDPMYGRIEPQAVQVADHQAALSFPPEGDSTRAATTK